MNKWEPRVDDFNSNLEVGALYKMESDSFVASWAYYDPSPHDPRDSCSTLGKFHKDSYLLYLGCFKPDKPYPTRVLLFYHLDDNKCYWLSNPHLGEGRRLKWPVKVSD